MAEKLRVAILGAYPLDTSHILGGVQAAYAYLVKGLVQTDDLDLHILTFGSPSLILSNSSINTNLSFHFIPPYPRFERLRNYHTYQATINQKLAQIRPHLIHAQDAGADALVALRSGFPTVITVHGIRWEDGKHYSSGMQRLRMFYDSFVTEQYAIRHTRHMIAISPYVKDYFRHMLRTDAAVYDVPNAIDERFFQPQARSNEKIVLFAGRVIPRKRVMDLVRAFALVHKQIPGARLNIAGELNSEPEYVALIRSWVHEAGLDTAITFLGSLAEELILNEYKHCSVLALSSAQETAPMVIAQAMAAGKPVVATQVGGVAQMVGEDSSRGLLVNVGDINGMASGLIRLLSNPDLQHQLGQNGNAYAVQNFHYTSVARRTSEIYHQISNVGSWIN